MTFFNKELLKVIMKRTNFLQKKVSYKIRVRKIEYVIQNKKIFVSSFKKNQNQNLSIYQNLNEKPVADNKLFWKAVKLLLSDKVADKDNINVIEKNYFVKTDLETDEGLNRFFSNTVQNLDISRYLRYLIELKMFFRVFSGPNNTKYLIPS